MKNLHWIIMALALLITVAAQYVGHPHYWWEKVPGFFAMFGFFGCLLIIFTAKTLGAVMVSRKPDYYKDETDV